MDWKRAQYKGFFISVMKLRGGRWVATVEALPTKGAMSTAGPGEGDAVRGEFDSEEAAVEAGKRYVDRKVAQRNR